MRRLPLQRVEKLVEASVFHPSPCKLLRERVLNDAVQASARQATTKRVLIAVSAAAVLMGVTALGIRLATTSSTAAESANAVEVDVRTAEQAAAPVTQPSGAGSLGEVLYQRTDGGHGNSRP